LAKALEHDAEKIVASDYGARLDRIEAAFAHARTRYLDGLSAKESVGSGHSSAS
jgi:hypothetical protein